MLPGEKYKPEDLLAIAWKRRWFIAGLRPLVARTLTLLVLTVIAMMVTAEERRQIKAAGASLLELRRRARKRTS
jgi:hypothetical protein